MSAIRYDPWSLLDLRNLFDYPFTKKEGETFPSLAHWTPSVDIKTEDKQYLIYVDVPGVEPDDIEVSVEQNALIIKGDRHTEKEEKEGEWTRTERFSGSFFRQFTLPANADSDKIDAHTKNGVLEIVIPKKKVTEKKRVSIKETKEAKGKKEKKKVQKPKKKPSKKK